MRGRALGLGARMSATEGLFIVGFIEGAIVK